MCFISDCKRKKRVSTPRGPRRERTEAHDSDLVCVFLASRPRVLADEGAFRVEDEAQRLALALRLPAQRREVNRELPSIGRPRSSEEDELEELHALETHRTWPRAQERGTHPADNGDPAQALLEGDVDVPVHAVRTHEICEAPGVPPVQVDLHSKVEHGPCAEHVLIRTWWLAMSTNCVGRSSATGVPSASRTT